MKPMPITMLAALALLATLPTSTVSAQQRIDRRLPVSADGVVDIYNPSGSVRVVGWGNNEVSVTGMLGEGVKRMDFTGDSVRAEIRVVIPKDGKDAGDSDLEVHVPKGSRVRVKTMSADIEASKVTGTLDLNAMSGDVRVHDHPRELGISTMSGDVDISHLESDVRVKTFSGEITVRGVVGQIRAETMSGDIIVRYSPLHKGRFSTMSGEIRYEGDLFQLGTFHFNTMSGLIDLRLPETVNADFSVTTGPGEGDIENELGPKAVPTGGQGPPGQKLSFSTGTGGAFVKISTMNGKVRLLKKK